MKYLLICSILIIFSTGLSASQYDSIAVAVCNYENANCYGFDNFSRDVSYYKGGKLIQSSGFTYSGCQYIYTDLRSYDTFYTYDLLNRILTADNYEYKNYPDTIRNITTNSYNDAIHLSTGLAKAGSPSNMINLTLDSTYSDSLNNVSSHFHYQWNVTNSNWEPSTLDSIHTDSPNNLINHYFYQWNVTNSNWEPSTLDSIHTDSLNNLIYHYFYQWNDTNSNWYLLNYILNSYNSFNLIATSDDFDLTNSIEHHYYTSYDVDTNLILQLTSYRNLTYFDSSKFDFAYLPVHQEISELYQKWDTVSHSWIEITRSIFEYDSTNHRLASYSFSCPDSTCSDSLSKTIFEYDSLMRLTSNSSFRYDNVSGFILTSHDKVIYDSAGLPFEFDSFDPDGSSCGGSSTHETNAYNSNRRLIHYYSERYTCDYFFEDCDYYTLENDSMLVQVNYFAPLCQGDTIQPIVIVAGGTTPYNFQWMASGDIIDPTSETPHIVIDSTDDYILFVTDSNGFMQSDTLHINVNCFTTSINSTSSAGIFVFPNPIHDQLTINLPEQSLLTVVTITNAFGQEVSRTRYSNTSKLELEIQGENGLYFVRVVAGEKSGVYKIVKMSER